MTDRILILLVNGDWLALDEDQFTAALAPGRTVTRPAVPNLSENISPNHC